MTLLDHFKDPNFWHIFTKECMTALGIVLILVVIFWLLDKLQKNKKPDLTTKLNAQETWMERFKK